MKYYDSFREKYMSCTIEGVLDYFNERIRIDHYTGDIDTVIEQVEKKAAAHSFTKWIIKGKGEHLSRLLSYGYALEAIVPGYFRGHDACFVAKYTETNRRNSAVWMEEETIVQSIQRQAVRQEKHIPEELQLRNATKQDAPELAQLFGQVFQIYPTPLNQTDYIVKTMQEGTVYVVFETKGSIVSVASAEIDSFQGNAELTNCATLSEFRKHGLMKRLLEQLEKELRLRSIFCAYTIARALSYGMNAAFYQLGYTYMGRMPNNCYIFNKMEDMNVWVKDLACINGK